MDDDLDKEKTSIIILIMRLFFVYRYIFPDNKTYIGQTFMGSRRIYQPSAYRGQLVYSALVKKQHKLEIIAENLTKEQADDLEISLIKQYNSTNRTFGYNVAYGGSNAPITEAERQRIREISIQKSEKQYKPIDQYDLDGNFIKTWPSRGSVERYYGWTRGMVGKTTKPHSGQYTVKGFVFRDHVNPPPKKINTSKIKHRHLTTPVNQFSLDHDFIQSFESIKEAAEANHITQMCITLAINGHCKTGGGFIWEKSTVL